MGDMMLEFLAQRLTQLRQQMKQDHKNKVLTSTEDSGWPYEADGKRLSVEESLVELGAHFSSLKKEIQTISEQLEEIIETTPRAVHRLEDVRMGRGDTLLRLSRADGKTFTSHSDAALALTHENSDIGDFADIDISSVGVLSVNEDADGLTTTPAEDLLTIQEVNNPSEANRFSMTFLDTSSTEQELDLSQDAPQPACVRVYRTSLNNQATIYLRSPTQIGDTTVFIGKDDPDEIGLIIFNTGLSHVRRVRRFAP